MPLDQADIDRLAALLKPALAVTHENTKTDVLSYATNGLLNVIILAILGFVASNLPKTATVTPVTPTVVVPSPAPVDPTAAALKDLQDGIAKINSRLDLLEKKK